MKVKLEEVCKRIYAGGDVPKDKYSEVKTEQYQVPIYANAEKDEGLYGYTDVARENDLSITVAARGTIGYTAIRREPFLPVVRLITVVPNTDKISVRYLYYALKNCKPQSSGTSIPQLTVPDIKKTNIYIYGIDEQEKIADILDKAEAVIETRKLELQKLDDLIKARFVELFENGKYEKVTVHSVLNVAFWLMPATPEFITDGEIPYITSKNIKNRMIDFINVKYISKEAYTSISANRPIQKGDILVSMIGTLGQTAVIQDDREFYGQNLYLLRLNNAVVDTMYFCEFFNSDTAQHELQGKRNQSTQAYLKANHVEELLLPLPPMELQEQFAKFVQQVDKSKFVF